MTVAQIVKDMAERKLHLTKPPKLTEERVYKCLWDNHQYFECLKNTGDAALLHERCEKLAREILNYEDHNLRGPIEFLLTHR